jgi:hypothetical protein
MMDVLAARKVSDAELLGLLAVMSIGEPAKSLSDRLVLILGTLHRTGAFILS